MKKIKKTFGIAGLALAIGLVLAACSNPTGGGSKSEGGTPPTPKPPSTPSTAYSGKIENYSGNGDIGAKSIRTADITDLTNINLEDVTKRWEHIGTISGGTFSFDLKNIPINAADLQTIGDPGDMSTTTSDGMEITVITNTFTVSDRNAKVMSAMVYAMKSGDTGEYSMYFGKNVTGNTMTASTVPDYTYTMTTSGFIYADRAVTIKGSFNCRFFFSDGGITIYSNTTYDYALQPGWNMLYIQQTASGDGSGLTNTSINRSTPFPDSVWYLSGD